MKTAIAMDDEKERAQLLARLHGDMKAAIEKLSKK